VEQLEAGKKPPVVVMLNGYFYRSTIAVMGGRLSPSICAFLIECELIQQEPKGRETMN